ncbi:murein L,D-transpeptidase [Butyrivibrio sp. CB08]|uniref:L,D-transpeptidase n=1 Tax=Butyrivibrio sp. CB08 TaxID=2364879 RepID=UPI000EA8F292|nr:L,D-transpeptidase [Butyrivibrio sp. CB08]RKM62394.1 murein L,D-transpeptidase [Butyrivibrio sp. CB08]
MKKALRGSVIGLIAIALLLVAVYVLLGFYYMVGFPCFTWINGVYCTGKTVSEVNEELIQNSAYEGIAILDQSGARLFVSADDADMSIDYTDSLNEVFYSRNPFLWGFYVFKNLSIQYEPTVYINRNKVIALVSDWEIFVEPTDLECSIEKTADGYTLVNGFVQVPVKDVVVEKAFNAMVKRESVLDLTDMEDCYEILDLRDEEKEKVELFSKVEKLQDMDIVYLVGGDSITLTRGRASDFILTEKDIQTALEEQVNAKKPGNGLFIIDGAEQKLSEEDEINTFEGIAVDKNGNPIVSESKMYAFLKGVADSHDTSWMMDRYRNGEGEEVIVNDNSKGDGTIYDINSEFEYLKGAVTTGEGLTGTRDLQLSESASIYNAKEQLGNTYIEVNMGDQVLHYYVDGELNMEMPVVTGNVNRGRGTPTGIYPVYNKRYHTYLRGVDYVSYVNYWLGVHKGVGIHDANWRSKFGEEIYKVDGSHGCINCPESSVSVLWEVVDVGTPVILYY